LLDTHTRKVLSFIIFQSPFLCHEWGVTLHMFIMVYGAFLVVLGTVDALSVGITIYLKENVTPQIRAQVTMRCLFILDTDVKFTHYKNKK
jgi:hypothetical protein